MSVIGHSDWGKDTGPETAGATISIRFLNRAGFIGYCSCRQHSRQRRKTHKCLISLITMTAIFSVATVCCVLLLSSVNAFSPTNVVSRSSVRGSTIVMDGKTRDLRDRIKSIKNTRRITEAMRLVAAARVRRAQEAVLKTRPLISQLQMVMQLCRKIFDAIIIDLIHNSMVLISFCHLTI